MSSSSATATASRSPSPTTPESSDSALNPITIRNDDFELSSWYHTLHPNKTVPINNSWEDGDQCAFVAKDEEHPMLEFDDLIDEHAYDNSGYATFESSPLYHPSPDLLPAMHSPVMQAPTQSMHASDSLVASGMPISHTKPIPPPAARPRKRDSFAATQRVVYPPKESCYNLPIMVPSIPEGGTKSRVETQVRVTVDLAHASASSGEPYKYDRVGSWKWLKLPTGTATKRRTRKEGRIDPIPQDMLYLAATVSCASPPHNAVLSCASCQAREAKRVARKLAARVRPARSDSDSPEDYNSSRGRQEDTTSIIQFNCPEVLDFTTGSVVLPLRITCYCRHHREKVGFNVHFTMMDHTGRIVGAGTSRPIMITDDHKTVNANKQVPTMNGMPESDIDWSQFGQAMEPVVADATAPSKRKQSNDSGQSKKRSKPYDSSTRNNSARGSREASVVSLTSFANNSPSMPHTRASTPAHFINTISHMQEPVSPHSHVSHLEATAAGGVSPSDTLHNSGSLSTFGTTAHQLELQSPSIEQQLSTAASSAAHYSPNATLLGASSPLVSGTLPPQPMPYMFFNPSSPPPMSTLAVPKIHRLIPAVGPTYGGIEVTILGTNFHPAMTLNCVFGDVVASSTQRWSDNTLVCVLPPRASPGVVAVWFDGVQKGSDNSPPCLFTYTDESDRALMELALQVVGLKMTGKIEDAKNVAMRIVGNSGADESQGGGDISNMMQLASASYRDIRPLLLTRAGDGEDFESVIVDFLSVLDVDVGQSTTSMSSAISHTTPSGQTLLHLAALLGFTALTRFLIAHDIDLDVRDRNGYTALHFAAIARTKGCAGVLVEAGADVEIVNVLGKTPQEQAPFGFFDGIIAERNSSSDESSPEDDDESRWGDAEEEDDDEAEEVDEEITTVSRRALARSSRKGLNPACADTSEEANLAEDRPGDIPMFPMDEKKLGIVDEKQTASFVDMIQRTLAQLHAPQGIIPNMPQLPLPHLPGMPAVPWGALQQIPVVFPIFVPMPGWPSFLGERRDNDGAAKDGEGGTSDAPAGPAATRAAQDWRATWEKWMAVALATATMRQEEAPPMYTPRPPTVEPEATKPSPAPAPESELLEGEDESSSVVAVRPERPATKRPDYAPAPVTDQDVNAYGYRSNKNKQKLQKSDRMLVYFWIPILIVSLVWALYSGARFALQTLTTILPLNGLIRA